MSKCLFNDRYECQVNIEAPDDLRCQICGLLRIATAIERVAEKLDGGLLSHGGVNYAR